MDTRVSYEQELNRNPIKGMNRMDTPQAAAGLVLGALVALVLLRRGFRVGGAINANIGVR